MRATRYSLFNGDLQVFFAPFSREISFTRSREETSVAWPQLFTSPSRLLQDADRYFNAAWTKSPNTPPSGREDIYHTVHTGGVVREDE